MSLLKWCGVALILFSFVTAINLYETYRAFEKVSRYTTENMPLMSILQGIGLAFTEFMLGFILLEIDTEPQPQAQPTPQPKQIEKPKPKRKTISHIEIIACIVSVTILLIALYFWLTVILKVF